jgi:hypothetical protein
VIDEADFNDEDKLGRGKEMQDRLSKLRATSSPPIILPDMILPAPSESPRRPIGSTIGRLEMAK